MEGFALSFFAQLVSADSPIEEVVLTRIIKSK
jgi:hypothetical protein